MRNLFAEARKEYAEKVLCMYVCMTVHMYTCTYRILLYCLYCDDIVQWCVGEDNVRVCTKVTCCMCAYLCIYVCMYVFMYFSEHGHALYRIVLGNIASLSVTVTVT